MGYLFIGNLTLKSDWILASNFSSQYHPSIKCKGHNNKGKDYQLKKLLIAEQILWKLGLLCQTSYLVCDQISRSNFSHFQCIQEKKIIFSYFLPHYIVYLNEGGYFKGIQSTCRRFNSPTPTRQRIKSSRDIGKLVLNPIQLMRS